MKVNLNDVIESIEFSNESLDHYYNKKTGIIIYVEDESESAYNADDFSNISKFEDWEQEIIKSLYDFKQNPNNYIKLPNLCEISEDEIMLEFLKSINDSKFKDLSLNEVRKTQTENTLRRYIEDIDKISEWFDFREDVDTQIAKAWCIKHSIEYM